jgi:hypothetical protein
MQQQNCEFRIRCRHAAFGLVIAFLVGMAGCASEPASQKRIAIREQSRAATMQDIKDAESRRPFKFRRRMDDIRRYEARKEVDYRESRRLAGDRFW